MGYVLRKPLEKDPRQDKKAVRRWVKFVLPKLQKKANQHNRVIFYADEAAFLLNPVFHRIYTPLGQAPIVHSWDKSFYRLFVCSAISSQGEFIYTLSRAPYTGEKIIAFLKKLLQQIQQPITLIWDGASIHRCKAVRSFLDSLTKGRLKLVIQPSYSPELNPDEQVWNYIKNVDLRNRVFKSLPELEVSLKKVLTQFKQRSKLIQQFFYKPSVAFY